MKKISTLEKAVIIFAIIIFLGIYILCIVDGYIELGVSKSKHELIGVQSISYEEMMIELETGVYLRNLEVIKSDKIVILNYNDETKIVQNVDFNQFESDFENYLNEGNHIKSTNKPSILVYYFKFIYLNIIMGALSCILVCMWSILISCYIIEYIKEKKLKKQMNLN